MIRWKWKIFSGHVIEPLNITKNTDSLWKGKSFSKKFPSLLPRRRGHLVALPRACVARGGGFCLDLISNEKKMKGRKTKKKKKLKWNAHDHWWTHSARVHHVIFCQYPLLLTWLLTGCGGATGRHDSVLLFKLLSLCVFFKTHWTENEMTYS